MIEYVVIMKQNGTLLYSKAFHKLGIDEEIIMGFFAAMANFSKEALQSMVEEISLGMGKRVVLVPANQEKLLAAAIISTEDNLDLVRLVLDQFLGGFITKFGPHYQGVNPKAAEDDLNAIITANSVKLSFKNTLISWAVLLGAGTIMFLIALLISGLASGVMNPSSPLYYLFGTIFVLIVYPIPLIISTFFAGKKKMALVNMIFYLIMTQFLFLFSGIIVMIVNLPVIIIISILFVWLGLLFSDKKKLKIIE